MKTIQLSGLLCVLAFALIGCKTQHDCQDGSVYVRVTCDETPAGTNEIVLAVSDANGGDMHIFNSCADKPSLEVSLTKYAAGAELLATVTFRKDGTDLAKPIKRSITLKTGCTPYDFQIAAADIEVIDGTVVGPKLDAGETVDDDAGIIEMPGDAGEIPLAGLGSACTKTDDCTGGAVCVSNVCCNAKCDGTCESCLAKDTGGADGFCKAVTVGKDPKNACTAKSGEPCGAAGACDGQGKCALAAPGTSCGAATCGAAGQVVAGGACDGKGACGAGTASSCSGYACKSGSCANSCVTDGECVGVKCINNKCGGKRALGDTCADGSECGSGSCVQNICCDSACTDNCKSCKMALTGQPNGKCSFVKAGEAWTACPAESAASCGNDGTCDGQGGCRKRNVSTVCAGASCDSNAYRGPWMCDGAGACKAPAQTACGLYSCGANGCKQPCGSNADCVAGNVCDQGVCKAPVAQGGSCSRSTQCGSGYCADGICCNEACNGECKQCLTGTCLNVANKADPDTCPSSTGSCSSQSKCLRNDGQPCTSSDQCSNFTCSTFTVDADGDGYGSSTPGAQSKGVCGGNTLVPPAGFGRPSDCCDADADTGIQYDDAGKPNSYSFGGDNCGQYDLNCDGNLDMAFPQCSDSCPGGSSSSPHECIVYTGAAGCGKPVTKYLCYYSLMNAMSTTQGCR